MTQLNDITHIEIDADNTNIQQLVFRLVYVIIFFFLCDNAYKKRNREKEHYDYVIVTRHDAVIQ